MYSSANHRYVETQPDSRVWKTPCFGLKYLFLWGCPNFQPQISSFHRHKRCSKSSRGLLENIPWFHNYKCWYDMCNVHICECISCLEKRQLPIFHTGNRQGTTFWYCSSPSTIDQSSLNELWWREHKRLAIQYWKPSEHYLAVSLYSYAETSLNSNSILASESWMYWEEAGWSIRGGGPCSVIIKAAPWHVKLKLFNLPVIKWPRSSGAPRARAPELPVLPQTRDWAAAAQQRSRHARHQHPMWPPCCLDILHPDVCWLHWKPWNSPRGSMDIRPYPIPSEMTYFDIIAVKLKKKKKPTIKGYCFIWAGVQTVQPDTRSEDRQGQCQPKLFYAIMAWYWNHITRAH